MDFTILKSTLSNQPKFRLKQAMKAVFSDLISDWNETTVLPAVLRDKLNKECPLSIKAEIFESKKSDSAKALLELQDGLKVETVLMRHKDNRNTVCVSSQVGCLMGCKFCATGKMGFKRNLSYSEILQQVLIFSRYLNGKGRITNIVFMGMGEPFLNYENVMEAIKILNSREGFGIGARHISISTCGVIEGIKKLAGEKLQINLAISLHAPDDKLRSEIMPANKKYPLDQVLEAAENYAKKTNRRVMFEYLMINKLNDTEECALQLSRLIKNKLFFVNLILYNETGELKSSTTKQTKKFKSVLEMAGIDVVQRYRFGEDLQAACGQLAASQP